MGKLAAFLVGTFLLLALAYSELASGFSPLINWLGPVFGVPLQFLLGLIFMMVGNPIAYPSVLIAWIVVGVVIGLIVRRTGGAILSAFLAYAAGWLFLILTAVMIFFRLFPSGIFSSLSTLSTGVSVPPAPPGTDIATILHEPLLNGLPSLFASVTSGGGAFNSVTTGWVSVILAWVGNFVLLLFVAGVTGLFSRKVFRRSHAHQIPAFVIFILFLVTPFLGIVPIPPAEAQTNSSLTLVVLEFPATTLISTPFSATFVAYASGGVQPYTITWTINSNPTTDIGQACPVIDSNPLSCTFTTPGTYSVSAQVTDHDEQKVESNTISISAEGRQYSVNLAFQEGDGTTNLLSGTTSPYIELSEGAQPGGGTLFATSSGVEFRTDANINWGGLVLPDILASFLGYSYPWYTLTISGQKGNSFAGVSDDAIPAVQLASSSCALPPCGQTIYADVTDLEISPGVGGMTLQNLNFTASPTTALALSEDTVSAVFAAAGIGLAKAGVDLTAAQSAAIYIYQTYLADLGQLSSCLSQSSSCASALTSDFGDILSGLETYLLNFAASLTGTGITQYALDLDKAAGKAGGLAGAAAPFVYDFIALVDVLIKGRQWDMYQITTLTVGPRSLALAGLQNTVQISSLDISSSTPCTQGFGTTLEKCFTLQQNFFVSTPTQSGSYAYWAQNALVVGEDNQGNDWVSAFFDFFNSGDLKNPIDGNWVKVFTQVQLPVTLNLTSYLSNGRIVLNTKIGTTQLNAFSTPPIYASALPDGSYIYYDSTAAGGCPAGYCGNQPQLDIVGPPTLNGGSSGQVTFGQSTTMTISSSVELVGQGWSDSVYETPIASGGDATSESSQNLQVACASPNTAELDYNSYAANQGVSFVPITSSNSPVISCINPATGTGFGSTSVTITGSGFSGATSVDFGQNNPSTSYKVVSDLELQAWTPPGYGEVDITITTPNGVSAVNANWEFDYVGVSSFFPNNGPESGGTLVTFTGNGFVGPVRVWFGNTEATSVNVVSSTTITAVSPPGTGTVPVIVEVGASGNIPIESSDQFTYGTNVSPPYYLESILGDINPDGSMTTFYSFLSNSATQTRMFSPSSGEAFVLLFSQSRGLNLVPSSLSSSFSSYASFIPQTMVFLVYTTDCTDSQTQANTAANSIAAAIQAPDLNLILSFPLYNIETSSGLSSQACGFVYGSGTPLGTVGPAVAEDVLPSISQGGLINVLKDGLTSGFLIPGQTPTSVNATVLVAGFGSASDLSSSLQFILPYSQASIPSPTGLIGFAGAVTLRQGVVHSSLSIHDVNLGQLLDYQRTISFANSSTLSVAAIGVPPPGSSSSSWTDLAPTDQLTLYTNNPSMASSFGSQSFTNLLYSGQSMPSTNIHVTFTGLFPANLKVSKSFTQGDGGNVLVSINVRNLDASPVTLISEDDSFFLDSYSGGANLMSGTPMNASSMTLNPNSIVTYKYTVHLTGIGSYDSTPATVTYLLNGTSFNVESNSVVWQQTTPSAPQAIFGLLGSVASLVNNDIGTGQGAPIVGSVIIYAPILLLMGLAARSEYRSFRGWGRISPEAARKLEELKRMLDSGLITEKEYKEQQRRLAAR